jgi:hypothetical protein
MSISGIKTAIKTAIEANLTGIPCYTRVPGSPEIPCAFVVPKTGSYLINFPGSKVQVEFDVTLLLAKGDLLENVQDKLDTYLLPTGTGSMKAAIMATACAGNADWVRVTGFDYGGFTFSGVEYLGAKWHVQVMI